MLSELHLEKTGAVGNHRRYYRNRSGRDHGFTPTGVTSMTRIYGRLQPAVPFPQASP
ncbi:hypothetical protein [Pelotalea chapellei]|uniref:Uncharacterized protein n=1 Tax=Pelotalea chapellei TaxID=44671 RepID=A0ABS5UA88_9BACT|nr:hypothetical protein [Pelotalea chapellei]MBT1072603.1 hypothetical protein [Pelotalea chapellei]